MTTEKVTELQSDLNELNLLFKQSSRTRVQNLLSIEIQKVEIELLKTKEKLENVVASATVAAKPAAAAAATAPKRYKTELKNYAWDQSDKFLKIFVTLESAEAHVIPEQNVQLTYTENSMNLFVTDVANRDYNLIINNLLESIDVGKSYFKVKKDMIIVYLKKVKEAVKWSHVTSTEKRVKETKKTSMEDDISVGNAADPGAGLMNILQKMYETGDPEMKRMINKAWHEGQNKQNTMPDML